MVLSKLLSPAKKYTKPLIHMSLLHAFFARVKQMPCKNIDFSTEVVEAVIYTP